MSPWYQGLPYAGPCEVLGSVGNFEVPWSFASSTLTPIQVGFRRQRVALQMVITSFPTGKLGDGDGLIFWGK